MRTRTSWRVWAALAVGFLAAPGVFAQGILNPRITLSGGSSKFDSSRTFVVNGQTFNTQFANGGRAKARLTLDLTRHFSIEGIYGFGTSNLNVNDTSGTQQTTAYGIKGHEIQLNALQFFTSPNRHFRPFLTTGVGDAFFVPSDAAKAQAANQFFDSPAQLSSSQNISLTIGGGLEARSRHRIGIRFDVTDHISAVPNWGLPQNSSGSGGTYYLVSGIVHNIQVEAGLVFYLWRLE